jgi:hypothetical protein
MQIFTEDDNFDIISAIKSGFVEENENYGPIIGYWYNTGRSFINKDGVELFRFISGWDYGEEPDAVKYNYRIYVNAKRAWQKFFSTGSGIEFVFSSKERAEKSLKRVKEELYIVNTCIP